MAFLLAVAEEALRAIPHFAICFFAGVRPEDAFKITSLMAGRTGTSLFGSIPHQRCQFHLIQNAMDQVPYLALRPQVLEQLRAILRAPNKPTAQTLLRQWRRLTPEAPRSPESRRQT